MSRTRRFKSVAEMVEKISGKKFKKLYAKHTHDYQPKQFFGEVFFQCGCGKYIEKRGCSYTPKYHDWGKVMEEKVVCPAITPICPSCKAEAGMDVLDNNGEETLFCSECGKSFKKCGKGLRQR